MPHKPYRHKLLLDENFPLRTRFKLLNHRFNLKHLVHDLHQAGLTDQHVYQLGIQLARIIITFNYRDFVHLVGRSKKTGVIGISTNLTYDQIDKKLTSLLVKKRKSEIYGNFIYISGESAT